MTGGFSGTRGALAPAGQQPLKRLATVAGLVAVCAVLAPADAVAQETRTHLTLLGFDKDYKHMLVKIDDNNVGLALRLYSMETGQPAKKSRLIEYLRGEEVATIKRAKHRYKIKDDGVEAMKTEDESLAFFGVEKGEKLVIAATDYKKLGKISDVQLKEDEEAKTRAKGLLKSMFWSTDRNWVVLVVNQKLKGAFVSDRDELYPMKFKKSMIRWVEPEEKKKEEEKEDEGSWWQFWK